MSFVVRYIPDPPTGMPRGQRSVRGSPIPRGAKRRGPRYSTISCPVAFFTMVVAACEVVVGLAIIVAIFRTRRSSDVDEAHLLRH